MKKLVFILALALSTFTLQACDHDCLAIYNGGNTPDCCPVPGNMVPGE